MPKYVLALLLIGCAPSDHYLADMYVAYTMSFKMDSAVVVGGVSASTFTAEFVKGAALWNEVSAFTTLEDTSTLSIQCGLEDLGAYHSRAYEGGIDIDCAYFNTISANQRTHMFAHQVGHSFGLTHIYDPNAIMWYEITDTIALTGLDVYDFGYYHYVPPVGT